MVAIDGERPLAEAPRQAYWALQPRGEHSCDRAPHVRDQAEQQKLAEPESSEELARAA